jgi:gamma-glutamyltranspeptidase / glutathione hydrolase
MTTQPLSESITPGDRPFGNIRSTRSAAAGRHGMIATSQALASAAGLRILQGGGNAVDAAVTAAGVLAVVEPSMNGIGGDLFALVYDAKTAQVYGLDACAAGRPSVQPRPSSGDVGCATCRAAAPWR